MFNCDTRSANIQGSYLVDYGADAHILRYQIVRLLPLPFNSKDQFAQSFDYGNLNRLALEHACHNSFNLIRLFRNKLVNHVLA
jgi:hypothetical protein